MVFPAQVYAEKEGTITHPDGRVQRVRQALGHAGESAPAGGCSRSCASALGAGTGALSAAAVTALVAEAVPFYAGITLDEIGGEGVRWQDRDAALARSRAPSCRPTPLEQPPAAPDGLVLGAAPSLWTGPEVEHSPSLRFLDTGPLALLSAEDARRLGVATATSCERRAPSGESVARHGRDPHRRADRQRLPVAADAGRRARRRSGAREAVAG